MSISALWGEKRCDTNSLHPGFILRSILCVSSEIFKNSQEGDVSDLDASVHLFHSGEASAAGLTTSSYERDEVSLYREIHSFAIPAVNRRPTSCRWDSHRKSPGEESRI